MKSGLISAGLLMIGLAACQNTAPPAETAQIEDPLALEQFAIAQIYETFPTRALVDRVDISAADGAQQMVRIEMTGAPMARKIYQVYVTPLADGTFELETIETVQ
ncbi:MAG: hypothetical protein AAFR82_09725 [Pseudomonadota bacterium]